MRRRGGRGSGAKEEVDTLTIHTDPEETVLPRGLPSSSARGSDEDAERLTRDVLGKVAGRWSLGVLCALDHAGAPLRFSRVLDGVEGITQKVLTATLRHLERDGFVSRRVFAQVPPRVEYELTPLGRELYRRVDPLVAWARTHADRFRAARLDFERRGAGDI